MFRLSPGWEWVYHKPPEAFTKASKKGLLSANAFRGDDDDSDEPFGGGSDSDSSDSDSESGSDDDDSANNSSRNNNGGDGDLLDLMGGSGGNTGSAGASTGGLEDLFGGSSNTVSAPKPQLLNGAKSGFQLNGAFRRDADAIVLELDFVNQSPVPAAGFAIQFNKNSFGLAPRTQAIQFNPALQQGQSGSFTVPIGINKNLYVPNLPAEKVGFVECAMQNRQKSAPQNVDYFRIPVNLAAVTSPSGKLDKKSFMEKWKSIPQNTEVSEMFGGLSGGANIDATNRALEKTNFFHVASRNQDGNMYAYYSSKLVGPPVTMVVEIMFPPANSGKNACKTCVRSDNPSIGKTVLNHLKTTLCGQ